MSSIDNRTALLAKIRKRRSSVLTSIKEAYPEMQDEASLMERVDLVQQDTFRILFDTAGHTNPSELLGLDYVTWKVEDRLRSHFARLPRYPVACKGFPAGFVSKPDPRAGPFSSKFRQYQLDRLGDDGSGHSAAPAPAQEPLARYGDRAPQKAAEGPAESTSSPEHQSAPTTELFESKANAGKRKADAEGEGPANEPPAKRTRQANQKAPDSKEDTSTDTTKVEPPAPGHKGPSSKVAVSEGANNGTSTGKRPAPFGTYPGPFTDDADIPKLSERLDSLPKNAIPGNPLAWPKFVWQSLYQVTPPPPDGDYFALPLRGAWALYVTDDVPVRVHDLVEPTIRVVVGMAEEPGRKPEGKVLAVMFTEHGDPTSVRELNHLVETWGDVQEWHRLMLAGGDTMCGLDEFMRGRLLYKVASKFAAREA
jgi:hypothetical protein